jgi:NAD(P)-dependent dehydrogenase (short-subunit alcohol dehydrogenase family)
VNTASALGAVAIPNTSEYVASKHGVVGLTKAAAVEYGLHKIRVNAVLPGVIETPMVARLAADPSFLSPWTEVASQGLSDGSRVLQWSKSS